MPRAVVVSPDPGSDAGGAERFCRQLSAVLARIGYDVTLVGPRPAPPWVTRQGGHTLWQASTVPRLAGTVDLAVTTGFLGWPGRWARRRVHVYVGNMLRQARSLEARMHWRLRWAASSGLAEAIAGRGATVVALSEQAAEDARRWYRVRVDAVLHAGVDTSLFRPRDREDARRRIGLQPQGRYALFVGRGEPGKGPGVALEASRRAGFQLVAAGSRPAPGSTALGVLSADQLAWAYSAADAVVLPTRYEGFGYVALEALAAGVPIVTSPTGWARELGLAVPAYRPLLVPPMVEEVAAALARVGRPDVDHAVAAAREYLVNTASLKAFEQRWISFFSRIGACPSGDRSGTELSP
jgi:glycosyltransferase involved in cell wall biosynthesis